MLDGISSVNTGGNQPGLELNADAIAEVKVVTSAYQAEYGRSTGIQISGITKSGTNQFRGSMFDIERQGSWNANTWVNAQNGNPKPVLKERTGATRSAARSASQVARTSSSSSTPNSFRRARAAAPQSLPRAVAARAAGDFSQTTDNTGARFNLIRDAATNLPCTAADTRGCFQDGGVLGRIPQNRLYQLGVNILKHIRSRTRRG